MTDAEPQNTSDRRIGVADGEGRVIREDVLQCLSRKQKYYRLVLTSSEILLQLQGVKHQHQQSIERYSIDDLFGCHTLRHKQNGPSFASAYICFYLYPKKRHVMLSKTKLREKVPLVFEVRKTGCSYEENLVVATRWKEDVLKLLNKKYPKWRHSQTAIGGGAMNSQADVGEDAEIISKLLANEDSGTDEGKGKLAKLSISLLFIKRYLVVVNPVSGQGKGVPTFHEKIHPVFLEAGVKVDLLITERSGHAESYLANSDLSQLDGIITVGGDGLLYEVVNGLRSRADAEQIAKIPVGAIATGSGNGLARSLAHYAKEDSDYLKNPVLTTTLAAARGKVVPVNLLEVELDGKRIAGFLSVGWGLLSDIDVESEVLRAIGEPRFTVWSFLRLANLRFYKAKLSYIPCDKITREESTGSDSVTIRPRDPVSFEGEFISVYSSCQSYIGSDLIFAPAAKPGDGLIHLTYLTKDAGRGSALQFLLGIEKGNHLDVSGVTYVTVQEFSIRSTGGIKGTLTVDGESVTGEEIKVKVSPRPLNVFTL